MNELIISTYIQIIQPCLMSNNRQESAGRFLLESITNHEDSYCSTDLNSKKISRLVNRKDSVPDDIKQAACKDSVINRMYEYFGNKVMKDINPVLLSDLVDRICKLINTDLQIGDLKKEELINLYNNCDWSRFLADTFLYCLFRENKKPDEEVEYQDIPYLDEANYECPLTQKKLVEIIKNKSISKYSITQIFPENLPEDLRLSFESLHPRPMTFDCYENLIALSKEASENYMNNPTIDEFKELYDIKKVLSKRYKAKQAINRMELEEDIRYVISSLTELSPSEMVELEYNALKIDQKISDDPLLKNEIKRQVVEYYRFIENVFKELESNFDVIASEIKLCYLKLEKLGLSKEDIILGISNWIETKAKPGPNCHVACNIIVAFFIQNCEVFNSEVS